MIAARSVEDVQRGDYRLGLGEIHVASNTLAWANLLEQHPSRHELLRAADEDLPAPRLEPVIPRSLWPGRTARLMPALLSSKDFRLELSAEPYAAGPKVVRIGSFVVAPDGDRLVARTRDGRLEFDLVTVFAQVLSWGVMSKFRIVPPRAHCPRVTIDRLVVCRESWSMMPGEVAFAFEKDQAQGFLGARRWARGFGFPRHVFVKEPVEQKPFYVDFESAIYVNILARTIRRSVEAGLTHSPITITEMLTI